MNRKETNSKLPCILAAISLSLNLAFGLVVLCSNPKYLESTFENPNPDAIDYASLCKNIIENSAFSRASDLGPDALRTPGYPVLMAILRADLTPIPTYLAQSLMFGGIVYMVTRLAKRCFGLFAALFVGMLLIGDHTMYVLTWQSLTEISGLFFFIIGLVLLDWPLRVSWSELAKIRIGLSGLFFGIAIIIRPSFLLVPFAIVFLEIARSCNPKERCFFSDKLIKLSLLLLLSLGMPAVWVLRNSLLFGLPKLTPVSTHNLVYFVGAGAFQVELGIERYEAQAIIADEFRLPTYSIAQNPHHQNEYSILEIERSLAAAQWSVVFKYPLSLAKAETIGLIKGSVAHAIPDIAAILGSTWKNPGIEGMIRMDSKAYGVLFSNSSFLLFFFFLHIAHVMLIFLSATLGMYRSVADFIGSPFLGGLAVVFLSGYLTVALFGIDAVYRSRIVPLPALLLFCGYAFRKKIHVHQE